METKVKGVDYKIMEVPDGGECADCKAGIWDEGEGPDFPLHKH